MMRLEFLHLMQQVQVIGTYGTLKGWKIGFYMILPLVTTLGISIYFPYLNSSGLWGHEFSGTEAHQ